MDNSKKIDKIVKQLIKAKEQKARANQKILVEDLKKAGRYKEANVVSIKKVNDIVNKNLPSRNLPRFKKGSTFNQTSKAYGYNKKLSSQLISIGSGRTQSSDSNRPVGRPRGSLKHRSPFNGQPIPATEFYKQMRVFRQMQNQTAEQIRQQQLQQYAKQGVQPNQIQNVQEMQRQAFIQRQINQAQVPQKFNPYNPQHNIPIGQPVPPQNQTIWRGRRGTVGKDIGLFGPRQVIFGLPESFMN